MISPATYSGIHVHNINEEQRIWPLDGSRRYISDETGYSLRGQLAHQPSTWGRLAGVAERRAISWSVEARPPRRARNMASARRKVHLTRTIVACIFASSLSARTGRCIVVRDGVDVGVIFCLPHSAHSQRASCRSMGGVTLFALFHRLDEILLCLSKRLSDM